MSAAHTPGPLTFGYEFTRVVADGVEVKALPVFGADGTPVAFVIARDQSADDAARIVACVNHCEGINTDELTNSSAAEIQGALNDASDECIALRAQRDELAAALEQAARVLDLIASRPQVRMRESNCAVAERMARDARAALAKVRPLATCDVCGDRKPDVTAITTQHGDAYACADCRRGTAP